MHFVLTTFLFFLKSIHIAFLSLRSSKPQTQICDCLLVNSVCMPCRQIKAKKKSVKASSYYKTPLPLPMLYLSECHHHPQRCVGQKLWDPPWLFFLHLPSPRPFDLTSYLSHELGIMNLDSSYWFSIDFPQLLTE